MVNGQLHPNEGAVRMEIDVIKSEVHAIMKQVFMLGDGDIAIGVVRAFEAGVLDIPFAPSDSNSGVLMPVRDNEGAVRVLDFGSIPCSSDVRMFHEDKLNLRAKTEERDVSFQMVIDDVNAISRGRLVGRPN